MSIRMARIIKYKYDNKPLPVTLKRPQQKYLLLLSNQLVIIGLEFEVMKQWRRQYRKGTGNFGGKSPTYVVDMLPTDARINSQTTGLSKLLESLTIDHGKENGKNGKKK